MASILADLSITESTPTRVLRGLRRVMRDMTADLEAARAWSEKRRAERLQAAAETEAAWAWYEGRNPHYAQPQMVSEIERYEATRRKRARRAARRERTNE